MAHFRIVAFEFWTSDSFVFSLTPMGKFIYLYLITTPRTTPEGVYTGNVSEIHKTTGISRNTVTKVMQELQSSDKVLTVPEGVFLRNFIKHQIDQHGPVAIGMRKRFPKLSKELQRLLMDNYPAIYGSCTITNDGKKYSDLSEHKKDTVYTIDTVNTVDTQSPPNGGEESAPNFDDNNLNQNSAICLTATNNSASFAKDPYAGTFEEFWSAYPRRVARANALKAFRARVAEGVAPREMIDAAKNYAGTCRREGRSLRYIMYAGTFVGPDARWREFARDGNAPNGNDPEAIILAALNGE